MQDCATAEVQQWPNQPLFYNCKNRFSNQLALDAAQLNRSPATEWGKNSIAVVSGFRHHTDHIMSAVKQKYKVVLLSSQGILFPWYSQSHLDDKWTLLKEEIKNGTADQLLHPSQLGGQITEQRMPFYQHFLLLFNQSRTMCYNMRLPA